MITKIQILAKIRGAAMVCLGLALFGVLLAVNYFFECRLSELIPLEYVWLYEELFLDTPTGPTRRIFSC